MKPAGIILAILGVLALIGAIVVPTVVVPAAAIGVVDSTDSTTYTTADVKYLVQDKLTEAVATNNPEAAYGNAQLESTRITTSVTDNADAQSQGLSVFNTQTTNTDAATGQVFEPSPGETDVFAFNPTTSELATCCGANLNGNSDVTFSGIMPLKFPFNTPQADQELYVAAIQKPVTATFEGTTEQYGMELYKFRQSFPATQVPGDPFLEVPMNLAKLAVGVFAPNLAPELDTLPQDQPVALYSFVSGESEFLVEPATGQFVDGNVNQVTTVRLDGGTEDVLLVSDIKGASANVEEGAADIKSAADTLKTGKSTVPIALGILGVILLVVGILLVVKAGKKKSAAAAAAGTGSASA